MSSLREEVTQRRTAKAVESESVSVHAGGSALIVCQWRGESWVLPWAQFIGACLRGKDDDGQLELSFANYRVTVTGENLRGLLEPLAAQEIGCLRDFPAGYRSRTGESAPFIGGIEVCPLAGGRESPEPSAKSRP